MCKFLYNAYTKNQSEATDFFAFLILNNMKNYTHLIGIGWNPSPPNPRLPAYVIPSLVRQDVGNIIFVSSLDASLKNTKNSEEKEKIRFHTEKKIELLKTFREKFFDSSGLVSSSIKSQSDDYEDTSWLQLWNEIEALLSTKDRDCISHFFENCKKVSSWNQSKIYATRHAFWFYDLSFSKDTPDSIESVWWPQEKVFNIIRETSLKVSDEILFSLFWQKVYKNKVHRIIYPHSSRVVPYGEATRKVGKNRKSIEFSLWESESSIEEHYLWRHQKKAWLNGDIDLIHKYVSPTDYWDFFSDFSRQYHQDFLSL